MEGRGTSPVPPRVEFYMLATDQHLLSFLHDAHSCTTPLTRVTAVEVTISHRASNCYRVLVAQHLQLYPLTPCRSHSIRPHRYPTGPPRAPRGPRQHLLLPSLSNALPPPLLSHALTAGTLKPPSPYLPHFCGIPTSAQRASPRTNACTPSNCV